MITLERWAICLGFGDGVKGWYTAIVASKLSKEPQAITLDFIFPAEELGG